MALYGREATLRSPALIDVRSILPRVYTLMALGLLATAGMAVFTYNNAMEWLVENPGIMFGAIIAELVLVLALSFLLRRLSPAVAATMFFAYALVNGFTLSLIFVVYDLGSIGAAFFTTAGLFGAMSVIGITTKTDLTKMGSYLIMGLIGLLIAMVVNIFINSGPLGLLISIAGVIIFTGLTAYDTQKIKRMAEDPNLNLGSDDAMKLSIWGALTLYLDFINLFLFILRLFGRRR
jgi:uncharacterized protein